MEEKQGIGSKEILLMMTIAYLFSFVVRMIWVYQFQGNESFMWNDQLMINTNDGYFFASGAQKELFGLHVDNPRVFGMWDYGVIFFTTLFTKLTPFSLETVILYMPAVISSLVVIPIILIARLYKEALWGFFAALLGAVAWSYYNRTMTGYYDTDMFSAMAPMFILYFLMKSTIDFNLKSALYAALAIAIYPFLYDAGLSIVYAMGIMYAVYMIFYHRKENTTYLSLILIFIALSPLPIVSPFDYFVKMVILIAVYLILQKISIEKKKLMIATALLFVAFLFFSNAFDLILSKVIGYISTGTKEEGLHFYSVAQTVREAGKIPFSTFANRISGSQIGVIVSFVGYIVLLMKHRAFILALPLIGIGVFALWGGLRFTVYAVPVAAMSAVYLCHIATRYITDKKSIYILAMFVLTATMLYPNITHIIGYKVPTVLNKPEVQDLANLQKISTDKDYTLTWWDYGYPIWFYSDTNTLIDGGKHNNDNFIISKIMQTDSPELVANLSRLAVETYVSSGYAIVSNTLFRNGKKDQLDPNLFLTELESSEYKLPKKTRDIYLYMSYRMLRIFPTVMVFGNLDLNSGKKLRKIVFYPTNATKQDKTMITFSNGIRFDIKKGKLFFGKQKEDVRNFIITQNGKDGVVGLKSQYYHSDGNFAVVFMESYRTFVIMDIETFNSMYVQMFMLGKYNKNLFELVISSPYSRIYRLKI